MMAGESTVRVMPAPSGVIILEIARHNNGGPHSIELTPQEAATVAWMLNKCAGQPDVED